jgi:cell division protein FtsI (penicillin-binding protein 3)
VRLKSLLLVLAVLFGVVLARLVQVQIVSADRYASFGESQRVRSATLAADRGAIFDRNGNDLALSIPQRTVWADPRLITDPTTTAAVLAPVLGAEAATLESKLAGDRAFVYLARRVSDEVAAKVAALELPGIAFLEEPRRFTPGGDLARSVLGTVGVDNEGLAGLELQYDELLAGTPGQLVLERDPEGRTIPGGRHQLESPRRGDDLVLSLDRSMQYAAERALSEQITRMAADGGTAIVMRPKTGEILALANLHVDKTTGSVRSSGNNAAVMSVFEPGSVNKLITMSAALEEDVVAPDTVLEVPGELWVSDHKFTDAKPHPPASYTATEILSRSSNIGTILIGQQLGKDRIDRYLREFGFGTPTGLDFPNESAGLLLDPAKWSGTSIGSIPIGQGVAVTPMQMLMAFNVIANDGELVPPQLVLATVDAEGERHPASRPKARRVVAETTSAEMRAMLAEVVREGTGTEAAVDGYTVAGKTGTARKPQPGGGYRDGAGNYHYVATFAGFVPAEDPELSIIVVIDEPSNSIFGGSVAAPVFADLARYGLRLFHVPPTAMTVPDPDGARGTTTTTAPADPVRAAPAQGTTTTTVPVTGPARGGGA